MEKTEFKHNYKEFGAEAIRKRVQQMLAFRDEVDVETARVKFSYGNRKTGALVPSVSLIPVADCGNCKVCARGCYDVRNVCFQKTVQKSRANNSAIYHENPQKYFGEILKAVKFLRFFRWHVGGDIENFQYLDAMVFIAEKTPNCEFLAFTKMYDLVNNYIKNIRPLPKNLRIIFSDWRGAEFENPYNLPVSSPLWSDGTKGPHCTDKQFMCPGLCEECAEARTGCWAAKNGETILFEAH
ncbi:MAG: hypothetical protein J6T35_02065 [Bacteroidales bacterium]|nr:hypothetical protein [Bacteroidales bacterium]